MIFFLNGKNDMQVLGNGIWHDYLQLMPFWSVSMKTNESKKKLKPTS